MTTPSTHGLPLAGLSTSIMPSQHKGDALKKTEAVSNIELDGSNPEETQYLCLIRSIIERGVTRKDRTGTGTIALFGQQMRFSLANNIFPLLTTKRVFFRGVVEELLWFIRGDTNSNHLTEKGIHIWDGHGTREYLDSRGLVSNPQGDLGPVYGFQWRHFGAEYHGSDADYTNKGVDQLQLAIDLIRNNPEDRRIVINAWNPADLNKMALPPCHMFVQFFVANGRLSAQMYQRSCDVGLGVPFNIASYSLLIVMMAHVCGLEPGEFIHCMGDTHIYCDHVEALETQCKRVPRPFPTLSIKESRRPQIISIDDFRPDDFELVGYNPHGKIPMKMSV